MYAIRTKYHGPTKAKGARISASVGKNRVFIPYPHDANMGADAHSRAALELCRKLGWTGRLYAGALDEGSYVFVFRNSNCIYDAEEE